MGPPSVIAGDADPVSSDRASISSSAATVPRGAVQVEVGAEFQRTPIAGEPTEDRLAVQALLRAGVSEQWELRLGADPFVRLAGLERDSGFGDVTLSLRGRLIEEDDDGWWPAVAFQPSVKFPTAPTPLGSERPDIGAVLIASRDLPLGFSIDLNAGLNVLGQPGAGGYRVQGLTSGVLNLPTLAGAVSGFVELAFASAAERGGRGTLLLNAGLVYLVQRWLAIDLSLSTTLSGRGPDLVARGGFAARVGP